MTLEFHIYRFVFQLILFEWSFGRFKTYSAFTLGWVTGNSQTFRGIRLVWDHK